MHVFSVSGRWVLPLVGLFFLAAAPVLAERPAAPKLLPEKTLAYFRMPDVPQAMARLKESSIGRIAQDEQVKPLVGEVYGAAKEWFSQFEERVGLPLDEILQVFQGELSFALIDLPEGPPEMVLILEAKDRRISVEKLIEKGEAFLNESGGSKATEEVLGQSVSVYSGPGGGTRVYLFQKDDSFVLTTGVEAAKIVLGNWSESKEKTLADNAVFNSIMSRCAGAADDPPQLVWFVDPIASVRAATRGNAVAATGLALLPVIGLDGVQGVGGSSTWVSGEYDQINHFHLALESPRSGVIEMLAAGAGDTTPEPWVSPRVNNYLTLNWRVDETWRVGSKLFNSLQGEMALEELVKRRVSERLGADIETEIVPALEGRVTLVNWIEPPARLNSNTNLIGLKLKDARAFQPVFDKVLAKLNESITDPARKPEQKTFGGVSYWRLPSPRGPRRDGGDAPPAEPPPQFRQPEPCTALMGDYFLLTDSEQALQEAIRTQNSSGSSLASELDFKLIASKIKRQNGGDAPALVTFSRPEEGMRLLYDIASADYAKQFLSRQGENNPFFQRVDQAMQKNPLPPFSVIAKYLAPSGSMVVNDETGFHWMSFTLRRK